MTLTFSDGRSLDLSRPRIMGILNVTPDSFSDGGRWIDQQAAVDHALAMVQQGADLIDVGGESTRPGAERIDSAEQIRRTAPVIRQLRQALDAAGWTAGISIDTTRSEVGSAALDAGADLLNDVSAGRDDPDMLSLAAERGAPIVLMHMLGEPATMQKDPQYADVVAEVESFLLQRVAAAVEAGVGPRQIVLDPGIGFGKTRAHNLALLGSLRRFAELGMPVLLGTSRKRFMGAICTPALGPRAGRPPEPGELVGATCATTALGVAAGVRLFRVHDVAANRQAADVALAVLQAGEA